VEVTDLGGWLAGRLGFDPGDQAASAHWRRRSAHWQHRCPRRPALRASRDQRSWRQTGL